MHCLSCGHGNREGAKFCEECAAPLPRACPTCGMKLRPAARFCDQCGTAVEVSGPGSQVSDPDPRPPTRDPRSYTPHHLVEKVLKSRPALEGERKHVTVLFVDCVGFTPLAEQIDPEDMHEIMDRCFALLLAEVHRYEGTVNQFTGDGVMALFGAPVALEDAPRRAVMAALGIQRAIERLHAELRAERGIDFRIRLGINSGLVVVGKIGNDLRMDYTAIGDTTNLAARLQALAAPGSILISETTHRLVAGFFETRDLGLLTVKGKSEPVHAFEVVAERPVRGRIDAVAEGDLTPLAGRQRELDTLRDAFAHACDGHGQVVFLAGEAGIGKSRLLYEFRNAVAAEPLVWVEGRCASYGTATAFLPIVDALRRFYGIEDRDDEASAVAKVELGVAALGGDLAWAAPFIRQLLSLPSDDPAVAALDAATRRSETFRALKAATLQAAQTAPLVVVVEDLHWIDPASEEFLAFLADAVPAMRALLVCSHRPGYRHPFGDHSYHTRITVGALSVPEMTKMTGALLGTEDMPAEIRTLIAGKAEGNPFFVEEVTKSLLEEGVLRRDNGRIVLARALADVVIPDRIHDVIMARIDRLSDDRKQAIQVASVIGREFALRLLGQITEAGEGASDLVAELRALELIYEKTVHPELAYMFKHALTHDVAYESILLRRRKALHRNIGLAIEELYADRLAEHYETLAYHFTRGEDWERALAYHERAADKSAEAYATQAAAEHCRQALAIAERLGDRVADERRRHLEKQLALACLYLSEFVSAGDAYVRAAERSDDPEARAMDLGHAAHCYTWGHSYDAARQTADLALELARAQHLRAAEQMALCHQTFLRMVLEGEIITSEPVLETAVQIIERSGQDEATTSVRFWQMLLAEWSGDYRRTLALGEQIIPTGRRLRLAHLVIEPAWFIGKAECCLGHYGRAITRLSEAYEVTDRIGDRAWKTRILNTLGWCHAEFGSHDRARVFNERAAAIAHEMNDGEIIGNAEINLGGNYLALGDVDRARAYLEPIHAGLDRREPFALWRYSMHLFDGLGRIALAGREPERALEFGDEEVGRARHHRARKVEARALELRGQALLMLDRRDEAEQVLTEAVRIADRIAYPRIAWQALLLLAALEKRSGAHAEADVLAARARTIVSKLAESLPDEQLQQALWRDAERRDADLRS